MTGAGMDPDRRVLLWRLAALLALPLLSGPPGLVRALPPPEGGAARARITPPVHSVRRHG